MVHENVNLCLAGVFPHQDLPPKHWREGPGTRTVCQRYNDIFRSACQLCLLRTGSLPSRLIRYIAADIIELEKKVLAFMAILSPLGNPGFGSPCQRAWTWPSPQGRPGRLLTLITSLMMGLFIGYCSIIFLSEAISTLYPQQKSTPRTRRSFSRMRRSSQRRTLKRGQVIKVMSWTRCC